MISRIKDTVRLSNPAVGLTCCRNVCTVTGRESVHYISLISCVDAHILTRFTAMRIENEAARVGCVTRLHACSPTANLHNHAEPADAVCV